MLAIIGDVHGLVNPYTRLINNLEYKGIKETIQVGDLGFRGTYRYLYGGVMDDGSEWKMRVNPLRHRMIMGNHDEYPAEPPSSIGTYGMMRQAGIQYFFVRGAACIPWDKANRIIGIDWWPEEELKVSELVDAIDLFEETQPELMISHECPYTAGEAIVCNTLYTSRTQDALQEMFETHQPKLWVFGHYHQSKIFKREGTLFVCLNELEHLTLNPAIPIEETVKQLESGELKPRR